MSAMAVHPELEIDVSQDLDYLEYLIQFCRFDEIEDEYNNDFLAWLASKCSVDIKYRRAHRAFVKNTKIRRCLAYEFAVEFFKEVVVHNPPVRKMVDW